MKSHRPTYLDVNLNNLKHNYDYFKEKSNKAVFTVVKANAYGMGLIEVSKFLSKLNTNYLATATLDEALEIRATGITTPILVMGYTPIKSAIVALNNDITLTAISLQWTKELSEINLSNLKIHIKINSTMNRLGHNNLNEVKESIELLKGKHVIEGIYTHYCCNDNMIVNKDFKCFKDIVSKLDYKFKWIHASNSYNALNLDENFTNAVRVGIGLYGAYKSLGLKNIASLKSEVSLIRNLDKDETVSYNRLFTSNRKSKVAVLPIGYADGVLRIDSGNQVYIKKDFYEIIGTICMDQLMVKVDDSIKLYDQVEIFGDNIDPEDIAKSRNTIIYEVFTSISNRVTRRYIR